MGKSPNRILIIEELMRIFANLNGLFNEVNASIQGTEGLRRAHLEAINVFKSAESIGMQVDLYKLNVKEIDKLELSVEIKNLMNKVQTESSWQADLHKIESEKFLTSNSELIKHALSEIRKIKIEAEKLRMASGTLVHSAKARLYLVLKNILPEEHRILKKDFMGVVMREDVIATCNEAETELAFELAKISSELVATTYSVSNVLRDLLPKVNSLEQKTFLEEAILCYEVKTYRAAIVMTWLLTMDVLYEYVIKKKLSDFNAALLKNTRFCKLIISNKEDFEEMKEGEFLLLLGSAGIITGNEKKILEEKLGIRNTAAHPNSIVIKESRAANAIEDLVINIISKFQ
jgi:hypothetical protein